MDQDIRFREYCSKKELEAKKEFPDPYINELGEIKADDNESVIFYPPMKVIRPLKKNIQHFYYMTQKGLFFNTYLFIVEILGAIFHSVIITLVTLYAYQYFAIDSDGHNSDFWSVSTVIYTVLIVATNLMCLIRCSHITWLLMVAFFGTSIGPFVFWMIYYDRWESLNTQSVYSVRFILK